MQRLNRYSQEKSLLIAIVALEMVITHPIETMMTLRIDVSFDVFYHEVTTHQ